MDILYKYSSLLSIDFFNMPTVKISIPLHLNDPYESRPSENIKKAIEYSNENISVEGLESSIENMITSNGIISLSETQRNSLMWAHYGNHHKGICIGFSNDFLKDTAPPLSENEKMFEHYCVDILKPRKINYDNYRFDFSKKITRGNAVRECFLRHFFTKSDEWIYEKEHRCILSYLQTTHILATDMSDTRTVVLDGEPYTFVLDSYLAIHERDKKITLTDNKNIYKINKGKLGLIELSNLSEFSGVSFLKEIDPKSIKEIYFGCRADKKQIEKIYHLLKSKDHPLHHVKLYSFKISRKRFEMYPEEISSDSL